MNQSILQRIQILEEKFEYQDQTIDALNDVIIEQQAQINALEDNLLKLRDMLSTNTMQGDYGGEPHPPHY